MLRFLSHSCRAVVLAVSAGCGTEARPHDSVPASAPGCDDGDVAPATAAPAVGLWADRGADEVRVSARIGHPQVAGAPAAVSHEVETIETRPGQRPLRTVRNDATVRLDFLPPYGGGRLAVPDRATPRQRDSHPAATYAVSDEITLASYESCAPTDPGPMVRYFRRDRDGGVVTDIMLYRESVSP